MAASLVALGLALAGAAPLVAHAGVCGDGVVDAGEGCDGGACCDSKCRLVDDGIPCDDPCQTGGSCLAGECTGGSPVICDTADACNTGVCEAGPFEAVYDGWRDADGQFFEDDLRLLVEPFRDGKGRPKTGKWLLSVGGDDVPSLPSENFPGCTGKLTSSTRGKVRATLKCKSPKTLATAKDRCVWKAKTDGAPRELPDALEGTFKCTLKDTLTGTTTKLDGRWSADRVATAWGCLPAPAETVCRPSADACDIEEWCDGLSPECPPDGPCEPSRCLVCGTATCTPPAYASATCTAGACGFACDTGYVSNGSGCDAVCGDGECVAAENCATCAADCDACPAPTCGDLVCNASESCSSCPDDCGLCEPIRSDFCAAQIACCTPGASPGCAANPEREACVCDQEPSCCTGAWDDLCVTYMVATNCGTCPGESYCPNFVCEPGEDPDSCPEDCLVPVCGDNFCDPPETNASCSIDCLAAFCECDCQGCHLHSGGSVSSVASCTYCGVVPCAECDADDWKCYSDPAGLLRIDPDREVTVCTAAGCEMVPWLGEGGPPALSSFDTPLVGDPCPSCSCTGCLLAP